MSTANHCRVDPGAPLAAFVRSSTVAGNRRKGRFESTSASEDRQKRILRTDRCDSRLQQLTRVGSSSDCARVNPLAIRGFFRRLDCECIPAAGFEGIGRDRSTGLPRGVRRRRAVSTEHRRGSAVECPRAVCLASQRCGRKLPIVQAMIDAQRLRRVACRPCVEDVGRLQEYWRDE